MNYYISFSIQVIEYSTFNYGHLGIVKSNIVIYSTIHIPVLQYRINIFCWVYGFFFVLLYIRKYLYLLSQIFVVVLRSV